MGIFEGILMFFTLCMKFGLLYNFLTPDKMQVFFWISILKQLWKMKGSVNMSVSGVSQWSQNHLQIVIDYT